MIGRDAETPSQTPRVLFRRSRRPPEPWRDTVIAFVLLTLAAALLVRIVDDVLDLDTQTEGAP